MTASLSDVRGSINVEGGEILSVSFIFTATVFTSLLAYDQNQNFKDRKVQFLKILRIDHLKFWISALTVGLTSLLFASSSSSAY